jgi:hypothetical protein
VRYAVDQGPGLVANMILSSVASPTADQVKAGITLNGGMDFVNHDDPVIARCRLTQESISIPP